MKSNQTCSSLGGRKRKMGVPRKQKGVEIDDTKPHFFTVIVSPSLQLHTLRLPKKFVKDHGKHLSNVAYLRVPNGADWLAELRKRKGDVSLNRGWNQFAEYHSISLGYILVFRYDGNSRFRVLIFNTTTTEIDYSRNNLHQSANQKNKPVKVEGTDEDDTSTEEEESEEKPVNLRNPAAVSRDRVRQRANAFHSPNPFFVAHMQRRNFNGNSGPIMPVSHCRTYYNGNDHIKDIVLRVNEKTWHIACYYYTGRSFCVSLAFGWQDFVLENALKEGDSCVFELLDSATMTYSVDVFRISENEATPSLIDEDIKDGILSKTSGRVVENKKLATVAVKERLLEKANNFLNGSPGFIIMMYKSYIHSDKSVHVPLRHSKEYLKKDGDDPNAIVIYGKDQKSWKLKYHMEHTGPRLSYPGWREFRSDNCLAIDDVCAFKLISKAQKAYQVAIFRVNGK